MSETTTRHHFTHCAVHGTLVNGKLRECTCGVSATPSAERDDAEIEAMADAAYASAKARSAPTPPLAAPDHADAVRCYSVLSWIRYGRGFFDLREENLRQAVIEATDAANRLRRALAAPDHGQAIKAVRDKVIVLMGDAMNADLSHDDLMAKVNGELVPMLRALAASPSGGREGFDFIAFLRRQRALSERAFGPLERKHGVVDHIRKELVEIESAPRDLEEWIDVVLLALDGAWRCDASPEAIVSMLDAKLSKNEKRNWPDFRDVPEGQAIEHVRVAPHVSREGTDAN